MMLCRHPDHLTGRLASCIPSTLAESTLSLLAVSSTSTFGLLSFPSSPSTFLMQSPSVFSSTPSIHPNTQDLNSHLPQYPPSISLRCLTRDSPHWKIMALHPISGLSDETKNGNKASTHNEYATANSDALRSHLCPGTHRLAIQMESNTYRLFFPHDMLAVMMVVVMATVAVVVVSVTLYVVSSAGHW
ncbi:hypothetical protein EDC04DRAFT_395620 [Pisolithus marmoratus]|nr:hypothetical protein EDC04DRAFT_395620 [Pisolithus marmoratus]